MVRIAPEKGNKDEVDETTRLYGEPLQLDPELKVPIKNRSCTDILCLPLFLAFLVGWGVVAGFAATHGDPSRLLYPTDSLGRVCGKDPGLENKTVLLFFDLTQCATPKIFTTGCPTPKVCVKECPKENWFYVAGNRKIDKAKLICIDGVNPTQSTKTVKQLVTEGSCANYYAESQPLAGRCIPYVGAYIEMDSALAKASEVAEGVFQDIKTTWWILLIGFVIAMVVSIIWIFLLRFISAVMIWFSLVAFIGLSGFGCYYTLNKLLTLHNVSNEKMSLAEIKFTTMLSNYTELEDMWLILFIITLTVLVVCLLALIFLRKRITIAISLIGQASKAVGDIMSTLMFSIIPFILDLVFITFFCGVALYLSSAGKAQYRVMCPSAAQGGCGCPASYNGPIVENATCNFETFDNASCTQASCQFFDYYVDPNIPRLHIFNVIALFWSMFFISAFREMVLAGAFASWYWAFNKSKDVPTLAVTESFGRTLRYHIGTLAFGIPSASVQMICTTLMHINRKLSQNLDSEDFLSLKVFFGVWFLERFLTCINRNAYVYCAIYGKNFCVSAKNAFSLIIRNVVRAVVLDRVWYFLLFIGTIVVVGFVGVASFFIFSGEVPGIRDHLPQMNYYLTPVIIITIGTAFISSAFFSVYAMAVDTLFLCFLKDCERNDGSAEKPYYMSKDLMKILEKKNKFKEE